MRVNLIPEELQPTRPSPVPYMPLAGLLAISVIWLITQLAIAAAARSKTKEYRAEHKRVSRQLAPTKELPGPLARAESERDALKLKGAVVTALTHSGHLCTPILQVLAETAPARLRFTDITLDFARRSAVLRGYGAEENADIEVTLFLRSLNGNRLLLRTFTGAKLDYCNAATRGDNRIKEFSISMAFREDRLRQLIERRSGADGKGKDGKRNDHSA